MNFTPKRDRSTGRFALAEEARDPQRLGAGVGDAVGEPSGMTARSSTARTRPRSPPRWASPSPATM